MAELIINNKLGTTIKVPSNTQNAGWFKHCYQDWENETFSSIKKYINPSKYFLDIGSWNGAISLFAGQLCKGVICIEADTDSIKELKENLEYNNISEIYIYNNAIYNVNTTVKFGTNQYNNSWNQLNLSTSQIQKDELPSNLSYQIQTITYKDIFEKHPRETIGLIKIDIEGSEEYILEDTVDLAKSIPVLLSLHYTWWKNPNNLSKFIQSISDHHLIIYDYFDNKIEINQIENFIKDNPFASIVLIVDS